MITLQNISRQFGPRVIYDRVNASLHPTHRMAIIGPNGAGKTMLLRIIMGQDSPDSGDVAMPPDLRLGYLPQELDIDAAFTPLAFMLEPYAHLFELEKTYEQLAHSTDVDSAEYRRVSDELSALQSQQHVNDVYGLPSRALALLKGLGINDTQAQQPMLELSGGFRMRVVLARLLLVAPDMLLMDEPTNHLDMDSLIWLERFLARFRGGLLIVSHDRDFLNRVTNRTVEVRGGTLTQHNGTVREYLEWKESQDQTAARRAANIQAQIQQTERFIERFKAKNTKAAAARSKEKALDRLRDQLPEGSGAAPVRAARFSLKASGESGAVPVLVEGVGVTYGARKVLSDVSLTVTRGQKVAIIGPNGAGKTTLLKAIAGAVELSGGAVRIGYNTQMRYYSQHRLEQLEPRISLYDTVAQALGSTSRNEVLSILGAFMFDEDDSTKKVGVLSGGEKSRLSLATIFANPGNLLLLDEPTNHLDIECVERLSQVLAEFDGTIVVVSHDEYLLSGVANRVVEMRPGVVRDFPGALGDYRSYIEAGLIESLEEKSSRQQAGAAPGAPSKSEDKQERIRRREARTRLERAIEKAERSIDAVESELKQARADLESPSNLTNYTLLSELNERIRDRESEHDRLLNEWGRLQAELEQIPAA